MRRGFWITTAGLCALALACGDEDRSASTSGAIVASPSVASAANPHAQDTDDSVELSLVSYNVHGLPSWLAFDDPPARMNIIGPLLARYDVALVQEDWSHHEALAAATGGIEVRRGNGPRGAVLASLVPFCGTCGSGLASFSGLFARLPVTDEAAPLPGCSGWLSGANDCFATKGFLRVRLALTPAIDLDVVNLHLDAGSGPEDQAVRRGQLDALAARLAQTSAGRALVVAGDFNLNLDDSPSREILDTFRERLALVDAGARPTTPYAEGGRWMRVDHIFFRGGATVRVDALEAGEASEFVRNGVPLSDHPAVSVRLRLTRR